MQQYMIVSLQPYRIQPYRILQFYSLFSNSIHYTHLPIHYTIIHHHDGSVSVTTKKNNFQTQFSIRYEERERERVRERERTNRIGFSNSIHLSQILYICCVLTLDHQTQFSTRYEEREREREPTV